MNDKQSKKDKTNKTENILDVLLNFIYWLAIGIFIIAFSLYVFQSRAPLVITNTNNLNDIENIIKRYPREPN